MALRFRNIIETAEFINLLLTNKCNKKCNYCYEQHNIENGKWDLDKIEKILDTFIEFPLPNNKNRVLQFFGGEPLLEKEIIEDVLESLYDKIKQSNTIISLVTNGELLTPEFIRQYLYKYDNTRITISLDTFLPSLSSNNRGTTDTKIKKIIDILKEIPPLFKDFKRITLRMTIDKNDIDLFKEDIHFLTNDLGIKYIVVHPLNFSNENGYIHWEEKDVNKLVQSIFHSGLWTNKNLLEVEFVEGTTFGNLDASCIIGGKTLNVNAEGDISGCYFFVNHSAGFGKDYIVGNLFQRSINEEKIVKHNKALYEMLENNAQCQSCKTENKTFGICYQCPAGNIATGSDSSFNPNSTCQTLAILSGKVELLSLISRFVIMYKRYLKHNESRKSVVEIIDSLIKDGYLNKDFIEVICGDLDCSSENKYWKMFSSMEKFDMLLPFMAFNNNAYRNLHYLLEEIAVAISNDNGIDFENDIIDIESNIKEYGLPRVLEAKFYAHTSVVYDILEIYSGIGEENFNKILESITKDFEDSNKKVMNLDITKSMKDEEEIMEIGSLVSTLEQ
jgi:uncharacterized protein